MCVCVRACVCMCVCVCVCVCACVNECVLPNKLNININIFKIVIFKFSDELCYEFWRYIKTLVEIERGGGILDYDDQVFMLDFNSKYDKYFSFII